MTGDDAMEAYNAALTDLVRTAPTLSIEEVEDRLRALNPALTRHPAGELDVALGARGLVDPRWALRHPRAAVELAWRSRHVRSPLRTLRQLVRPRFAG